MVLLYGKSINKPIWFYASCRWHIHLCEIVVQLISPNIFVIKQWFWVKKDPFQALFEDIWLYIRAFPKGFPPSTEGVRNTCFWSKTVFFDQYYWSEHPKQVVLWSNIAPNRPQIAPKQPLNTNKPPKGLKTPFFTVFTVFNKTVFW